MSALDCQGNEPALDRPKALMVRLSIIYLALRVDARQAILGLFWLAMRKKVRGRALIYSAAARHTDYHTYWVEHVEPGLWASYCGQAQARQKRIAVVIVAGGTTESGLINRSLRSAQLAFGDKAQIALWSRDKDELQNTAAGVFFSVSSDLHSLLEGVSADYLITLFAGDQLSAHTGQVLAHALSIHPDAPVIYWDEDRLSGDLSRRDPWFKSSWNLLHFFAQDFLIGASMIRVEAINADAFTVGESFASHIQNVLINVATRLGAETPAHVPLILSHRLKTGGGDGDQRVASLEQALAVPVNRVRGKPSLLSVQWPLPDTPPSVSIIIPTRDRVDLLSTCIDGLLEVSFPGNIEIIVIDNESADPESHRFFDQLKMSGIHVMEFPGSFNFSAMNNAAVKQATGKYLCFLNNDIEMIENDWLTQMMRHAVRPGIGAVGAKLLYPDGTVQHAGVAVGIGQAAGHVQRNVSDDEPGYFDLPHITRYATAVTAACMVLERSRFEAIGGFDERLFPVAFNDVDLCLKLVAAGWKNVYSAEAKLIHHESKSRGDDMSAANYERYSRELANLQDKWATKTYCDPYLSPRFSRKSETLYVEID